MYHLACYFFGGFADAFIGDSVVGNASMCETLGITPLEGYTAIAE